MLTLITEPASEPVTLAQAKAHMRVDIDDDDDLITALLLAARLECENVINRSLLTQTWELVLDGFPFSAGAIDLPRPPIQSITSVTYIDANGVVQTMAPTFYTLDKDSEPGRLVPALPTDVWPTTGQYINAVRVRYVAGYLKSPEPINLWIKIRAATAYENREQILAVTRVTVQEIPYVDSLLDRYRIYQVF